MATLTLDNQVLVNLAQNPQMVQQFPFLAGLKKTCNCQKSNNTNAAAIQTAKQQIAGLSADTLAAFLKVLNATAIRFFYKDPSGNVVQVDLPRKAVPV